MRAKLRKLLTVDHDRLDAVPPSGEAFCISLRAIVGPLGSDGEESFDFDVCSPAWLLSELDRFPVISGRFLLIVRDFDVKQIEEYVRKRLAQASGENWSAIADKISRWAQWEFEDYLE